MTIAYFIRLESLIEKWQSRRKTIEISTASQQKQQQQQQQPEAQPKHCEDGHKRRSRVASEDDELAERQSDTLEEQDESSTLKVSSSSSSERVVEAQQGEKRESKGASVASGGHEAPLAYKLINNKRGGSSNVAAAATAARYSGGGGGSKKELPSKLVAKRSLNSQRLLKPSTLASCPGLLYTASALLYSRSWLLYTNHCLCILILLLLQMAFYNTQPVVARSELAGGGGGGSSFTQPLPTYFPLSRQLHARANMLNLIRQLAASTAAAAGSATLQPQRRRVRWTRVASRPPTSTGAAADTVTRPQQPFRPLSSLTDAHGNGGLQWLPSSRTPLLSRIRQRMGARNSIRVHNAFRDLLWRILSNLSMPTPVIYELRRQHLYSTEDDLKNDSLADQNTAQTIRSKRQLPFLGGISKPGSVAAAAERAASDDDDDDEPQSSASLRERARSRLDQLVRLSRRTLFGRVIRVPALFPFKRQATEETTSTLHQQLPKSTTTTTTTTTTAAPGRRRRLLGRRRKKEIDRQMIFINGKQYYVDDESGELKEVKDTKDES